MLNLVVFLYIHSWYNNQTCVLTHLPVPLLLQLIIIKTNSNHLLTKMSIINLKIPVLSPIPGVEVGGSYFDRNLLRDIIFHLTKKIKIIG